ncbi:MAG TPA: SRPBCC family protein [Acidimicrobiia bacterium]|nr:SRPBCC family protein [Acidimicrobiia bacterium]
MIHVQTSTHIDRPVEDVFAFVDDLAHLPEWIDVIADSVASEPATRIGTRVTNRIDLLGRHFRNVLEVIEREPNHTITLRAEEPFTVTGTFLTEAEDCGTRFTAILDARPGAFFRLGEPLLAGVGRRRFNGHLRRLKGRLESGDPTGRRRAA